MAFRSCREDGDPLFPRANADDRWIGKDGVEPAICAGDIIDGVHAEIAKHYEMAGDIHWPGRVRQLLTADLEISGFLDLLDDAIQGSLGVDQASLVIDYDDNITREVAFEHPRRCYKHALSANHDGVISASAAYQGMRVFVIRKNAIPRVVTNTKIEFQDAERAF